MPELGEVLDLHAKGLSNQQIADLLDCSTGAVHYHIEKFRNLTQVTDGAAKIRALRTDILSGLQGGLLAHVANSLADESKRSKISPYQAVGMFGILYDKERLETGKSSSNIAVLSGIITKSEESGDTALRKLSVQAPKAKVISQIDEADVIHDSSTRK